MKRLSKIFQEFLKRTGGSEEITLGKHVELLATEEHKNWFMGQLRENARINRTFVNVLIILHIAVLAGAVVLCVYWREKTSYIVAALGGSGIGVSIIILNGLRKLWREKVIIETVIAMLPTLPPKEAVEAIQSIFYSLKKR